MLEDREIEEQGEIKETRRRFLLIADSFSLTQVAERAVDVASTMTSRMRRGVAITVEALITWHLNVIKEMEVVFVKRPLRPRRMQTRMMHHLLDLKPMFNPTPTRNQFRRFEKRQIDF